VKLIHFDQRARFAIGSFVLPTKKHDWEFDDFVAPVEILALDTGSLDIENQ